MDYTMNWTFLIVFLSLIPLSHQQIQPINVHQTRQRLVGLSPPAFIPANNWPPYLSSQTSYGNYLPSYNQIMGNVISLSPSKAMTPEAKSGKEPIPKLSPEQRAKAREGLAAGLDLSDIPVLQNYPVHLLEQLEESLTESGRSTVLSSNSMNQKILNKPVRNFVANARINNWPGNNLQIHKMPQFWIRKNPRGNFIQNGIQMYPQTLTAGSRGAQPLVSNIGPTLLANSPLPNFVTVNTNRISQIPGGTKSNYMNPSVVSILMALSRLWEVRHNQGVVDSLKEKHILDQIDSIIRTMSLESKQIIIPVIQRFKLSSTVHKNGYQKGQSQTKGIITTPTFTGENSTNGVSLHSLSTISQMTQLEKPSTSLNGIGSVLGASSAIKGPASAKVSPSLNPPSRVNFSLAPETKANMSSTQPEINVQSSLVYSPAAPVMLYNELLKRFGIKAANSGNAQSVSAVNKTQTVSTVINVKPYDTVNTNPSVPSGFEQQSHGAVNSDASSSSIVNIASDTLTDINPSHSPVPRASAPITIIKVNQEPAATTKIDSSMPSATFLTNTGRLNVAQLPGRINKDSALSIDNISVTDSKQNPALSDVSKMNSIASSGRVLTDDVIKRKSLQSPATNMDNSVSAGNVSINSGKVNNGNSSGKPITKNVVHTTNVPTTDTNSRTASSSTSGAKDRTSVSAVDTAKAQGNSVTVSSSDTTSTSEGRNVVPRSKSITNKAENVTANLMKHKVIWATWKAFSKSVKDMAAYGNLLLALTQNLVNSELSKQV